MQHQVQALIAHEDQRDPLTDEQIAEQLQLRRDQVTLIRQELGLADSRERRRAALLEAMGQLEIADLSDRELTRLLNEQGFRVSRQVVSQCRRQLSQPSAAPQPLATPHTPEPSANPDKAFGRLVGAKGSIKPMIDLAKAAVLYPPHGLHSLILGPTGVGKSELAKAMYEFALEAGQMADDSRFITFNCADYAENPQLLVSQLFGVTKGAYTGANLDRPGLVEKADGGMLFLDEVHRLPPDGQEMLYYLIDHGRFRRLGETEASRQVQVMIVAATTEEVNSTLLLPFRRRIPMVIHLPSLDERPLGERLEYVQWVISEEATRIGRPIRLTADAVRALLLYDCPGNLGGLRGDLQVSCARSFVTAITDQNVGITIGLAELPPHVSRSLLRPEGRHRDLGSLVLGDLSVTPGMRSVRHLVKDAYMMPSDIYSHLELRHRALVNEGISGNELSRRLADELEGQLQAFVQRVQASPLAMAHKELATLVGPQVFDAATRMLREAKLQLGQVDERLLYCLATHLAATLERLRTGGVTLVPQLSEIDINTPEGRTARAMVAAAEAELGLTLPTEEVGYLTLYLRSFTATTEVGPRVGIVVLSHGRVASAMAEVANRLLGVNHARAVEMSLDEPPEAALSRAQQVVLQADEGRGVLLLADMGSLVTFGPLITEATGIEVRTIERVHTALVIDAVRRALLPGANLDEVAAALPGSRPLPVAVETNLPRAILAVCITGQGAARQIRARLAEGAPDLHVVTQGIVNPTPLEELRANYDLVAAVGTVDPGLTGVPFIPLRELLHGSGVSRLQLLTGHAVQRAEPLSLRNVLDSALLVPQLQVESKDEVLRHLADLLTKGGYVRSGFLAGVLERETLGPAVLGTRMAIPHADPTWVRRPGLAVAALQQPLAWGDGLTVEVVCMAALTSESASIVLELNELANEPDRLRQLAEARSKEQLLGVFLS